MNVVSHHYQLGESTFILRGVRSDLYFLSRFTMKFLSANRIAPDGTLRSAVSHLGLCYLPMFLKKDVRLKLVNSSSICTKYRLLSSLQGKDLEVAGLIPNGVS